MVSVILIWCYILITTFITGYGVLRVITRHIPYTRICAAGGEMLHGSTLRADAGKACRPDGGLDRIRHPDAFVLCGLVFVTVYAQFFSLFAGVGFWANLLLCMVCAGILWREREELGAVVSNCLYGQCGDGGLSPRVRMALTAGLFFLFAYGTSRGMIHYDTGLYHAQSIRWIEEYGAVRGLGDLHGRLAYNSSSFALSALYSMAFLGGPSFHCAAGFLAFVLAAVCLEMAGRLRAGKLRTSDFARIMCVYYLVNIFDEMISPASDYFMVLLAFYIVIRWLDLLESGERAALPYALLCVLGVFLMTVKLSAALILLLTIGPAYELVRNKRWRETAVYLGLGIVTALPFFIRNVIISGWLVYPFTRIDLFDVVWKIPKGLADYDAREIQVWGRGYTDVLQFDLPLYRWMPGWFRGLAGSDKVFVLAASLSVLVLLVYAAGMAFGWWPRRPGLLLVQGTVAASFLFWLGTSPLMRYGCVYVYLTSAVVFGGIYETFLSEKGGEEGTGAERVPETGRRLRTERVPEREGKPETQRKKGRKAMTGRFWADALRRAVLVFAALFLLYKGIALGREIAGLYVNAYWIFQKDYENYETYSYEIDGVTFYCPVEGDRVGYESFPSSPTKANIALLGEGLADGFRMAE